jgi:hypothetical protein
MLSIEQLLSRTRPDIEFDLTRHRVGLKQILSRTCLVDRVGLDQPLRRICGNLPDS